MATFTLQQRSWVVVTENLWPAKPEIFTVCLFTENVCGPLHYALTSRVMSLVKISLAQICRHDRKVFTINALFILRMRHMAFQILAFNILNYYEKKLLTLFMWIIINTLLCKCNSCWLYIRTSNSSLKFFYLKKYKEHAWTRSQEPRLYGSSFISN